MDPPEPARVTIKDVAERANVSISTVSRVINELDRVNPRTRQRVLEVIRELRYQPSALARGLAAQRTQTLGFVIPTLSDPFFLEIVRGVEEAAAAAGHNLLVASQPFSHDARRYLQLFDERRVDSMVLVGIKVPPEELGRLLGQGFAVAFVQQDGGEEALTFLADNYGGARALSEHLLDLAYQRIVYIAGSDYTPDNAERLRGLSDALAGRGLEPFAIAKGDYHRGSGARAMTELLARRPLPEAVFAANDQMAADAIMAIRERGLSVPEDIAVVGFDDVPMAGYLTPALTTVRQPAYKMGYRAARAVLNPEKSLAPARVVLPTQVVVRQSCGSHLR
jgi:DNA-binding LacI/PurR family transcriptional regulator